MDEVTVRDDVGEWMTGYAQGVQAGRRDVLHIVSRLLGTGILAQMLMAKVLAELEKSQ